MKISRRGVLLSAMPNFLMLLLFYSLAIHMYLSLGGWPASIGERGFPATLVAHGYITMYFFIALSWFGIFIWPMAIIICSIVRDFRRSVPYWVLYALLFLGCWGLMQLAPEPFLYWWRD
jgi:hypothetical protein